MGIKDVMDQLKNKTPEELTYTDISDTYIFNVRIDFDPVGIKFCMDENEIEKYPVNTTSKGKLTYCQFLFLARAGQKAMFMPPKKLLCENAEPVFGFRELDKVKDTKRHMKYLLDEKLAWEAPLNKEKLPLGKCKGIYQAPLSTFDQIDIAPDLMYIMCYPFQAYHILNDYMAGNGRSNLQFNHTPNSAVCAGSVWAFNNNTANMTTMCAGSKTSGKTDMSMVNVFIPGKQIKNTAAQLIKRIEQTGGPSVLGKGGESWPGLDVCKACPLFRLT